MTLNLKHLALLLAATLALASCGSDEPDPIPVTPDYSDNDSDNNSQVVTIEKVWVQDNGKSVMHFKDGYFTEYILESPYSDTYIGGTEGEYTASDDNSITLDYDSGWKTATFTANELQLSSYDNDTHFKAGKMSDIPAKVDYYRFLQWNYLWIGRDYHTKTTLFEFASDGKVSLTSPQYALQAEGTFSVSGSSVTMNFNSVEKIEKGYSGTLLWGLQYGEPATIIATVHVNKMYEVSLTSSDEIVYLTKAQ